MTERQRGDYCAILSRVLSGAWKYKVTILHENPQVITRSVLLLWSSCHASYCGSCFWTIHFSQLLRQSIPKYKKNPDIVIVCCTPGIHIFVWWNYPRCDSSTVILTEIHYQKRKNFLIDSCLNGPLSMIFTNVLCLQPGVRISLFTIISFTTIICYCRGYCSHHLHILKAEFSWSWYVFWVLLKVSLRNLKNWGRIWGKLRESGYNRKVKYTTYRLIIPNHARG